MASMMVALRSSNMSPHHTAEGENREKTTPYLYHAATVRGSPTTHRRPHCYSHKFDAALLPGPLPLPALHVALLDLAAMG